MGSARSQRSKWPKCDGKDEHTAFFVFVLSLLRPPKMQFLKIKTFKIIQKVFLGDFS